MNLSQIWQATLGTMQLQTSRHEFDTWLRDTALLSLESGVATIGTPSPFSKESLENRYMAPVRRSLGDVVGFPVQVRVVIAPRGGGRAEHPVVAPASPDPDAPTSAHSHGSNGAEGHGVHGAASRAATAANYANGRAAAAASYANGGAQRPPTDPADEGGMVQLDLSSAMRSGMLNPRYTFSRFIVGSSNRLAHAASYAVAEHPAGAYNPLFLYGGVGLGKTHLLHAIGNYALDRDPEITVMYVTSEKFTNDMINAIRRQQTEEFRLRYRNIDILLIDDIQFIAGKEGTQEEFFHTFNTLHSAGKQIVISSDKPPKAILTLEERLRSRFEWGLIVDVQSPDLETRTAILRAKSEQMRAAIAPEVLDFLAHKIQSNIRELEGSLNRVAAFAELNNAPITIELATAALAELFENTRRRHITPDAILQEVAGYYSMDLRIIQGRGRSRNVVVPRQVAMYLLREETDMSLVDIGGMLGGRDHTTVMYGCEKMTDEINADARLRADVNAIRAKLYAPGPMA